MRRLLFLLILAVSVAACGDEDPATDVTTGHDDEPRVTADAEPTATTTMPPDDEPIPVEPDGGIGDTPLGGVPFFGGNDTICPSLRLMNDPNDLGTAREASPCFLDAVDEGVPVVWDVVLPTIEGEPIYQRFHYTGDDVLIVRDFRADTFGSGGVRAERCASVAMGEADWLPVGVDCVSTDHPGFPEADTN